MKLSALIFRGQLVEVSYVPDDFQFGEHGNHYHIPVKVSKEHLCVTNPTLSEEETDGSATDHLRD